MGVSAPVMAAQIRPAVSGWPDVRSGAAQGAGNGEFPCWANGFEDQAGFQSKRQLSASVFKPQARGLPGRGRVVVCCWTARLRREPRSADPRAEVAASHR